VQISNKTQLSQKNTWHIYDKYQTLLNQAITVFFSVGQNIEIGPEPKRWAFQILE
jgi:hypothetical protein